MSTSIITLQRRAIVALIPVMTTTNGYNYNWITVNQRNLALGAFPRAEIYNPAEDCMDTVSGIGSLDYTNAGTWEIRVKHKLTTSVDNPLFDIQDLEDAMIDDLKMLFGKNQSVSGTMDSFLYKGFKRDAEKAIDQFTPRPIKTFWRSVYSQDRVIPTQFAGS
jgi:hypothetical protein